MDIVQQWLNFNKDHPHRNRRKDKHGFAPIHYAAKFNRSEIMTKLCEEGGIGKFTLNAYYKMSVGNHYQ